MVVPGSRNSVRIYGNKLSTERSISFDSHGLCVTLSQQVGVGR